MGRLKFKDMCEELKSLCMVSRNAVMLPEKLKK